MYISIILQKGLAYICSWEKTKKQQIELVWQTS